jgi:hypothetical protein
MAAMVVGATKGAHWATNCVTGIISIDDQTNTDSNRYEHGFCFTIKTHLNFL